MGKNHRKKLNFARKNAKIAQKTEKLSHFGHFL